MADAERLRLRLQENLQKAMAGEGPAEPGTLDVVVVGGGPTGVETTGALTELMHALHVTGRLERPGQITLVDRGEALLGQFSPKAHDYAVRKLTEAGADVKLEVGVTAVHADRVEFDDGSAIQSRTVVWAVGSPARPSRRPPARLPAEVDVWMSDSTWASTASPVSTLSATSRISPPMSRVALPCRSRARLRCNRVVGG